MIAKHTRLLFIGDSITAIVPSDSTYNLLTHRYVTIFETLFRMKYPGYGVKFLFKGVGGHTVADLSSRWETDVIREQPDCLFILVGINDASYWVDGKIESSPDYYEQTYDALLVKTRLELPNVSFVLMTPFLITHGTTLTSGSRNAKMYEILPKYIEIVKKLGDKHRAKVIDLDAEFYNILQHESESWLAQEPVHPGERGKLFIAMQLLECLSG